MAVGAVWRELVSGDEIPDLQGKYREFARNRLWGEVGFTGPSPFRGPTQLISLNSVTGKFLPTSRESRDANSEGYSLMAEKRCSAPTWKSEAESHHQSACLRQLSDLGTSPNALMNGESRLSRSRYRQLLDFRIGSNRWIWLVAGLD